MTDWTQQIRDRLKRARGPHIADYINAGGIPPTYEYLQLGIRANALPLYENAPTDLAKLLEAVDMMREALKRIESDSWYKNAYVPADDEQTRSYIIMNRVNQVTAISREALAKLEEMEKQDGR